MRVLLSGIYNDMCGIVDVLLRGDIASFAYTCFCTLQWCTCCTQAESAPGSCPADGTAESSDASRLAGMYDACVAMLLLVSVLVVA